MTERKPGRRPGDPEVTKQSILDAALEVFGEKGFDRATIRSIASRADVDPALIHHHFGSKQGLFAAVHQIPVNPTVVIAHVATLQQAERAEALIRAYLGILFSERSTALSLIKGATSNEAAARMLGEFIESVLLDNAHRLTDRPQARLRVAMLGSHMIGILFARHVVGLEEFTRLDIDDLVPILVPVVERYLHEPLGV